MEEIYKKYSVPVYRYLYSLTNNHELSEELMQETFYSAIKNINRFREDCNIYWWLCAIAKNKWKDYKIKNNKMKTVEFNENIDQAISTDNIEEEILSRSKQMELYSKMEGFDEITKKLIYLRAIAGMTFKEIGQILNKSESWARTTFYRVKIKIIQGGFENEERM